MVVLVTGCSSGFGVHIAAEAARRGHVVYAGLRDPSRTDALDAATGANPRVRPVQLDVTDSGQRRDAVARILAEEGRIDALVNNAGVALGGFLESVEEDELRAVLETNVIAPWALTRDVLPAMRVQRAGRVIMVSSLSGRVALPGVGVYAASKFALEGLSESWRHELALWGIQLALVEPAQYRTDIFGKNRRIARRATAPDDPWRPYAEHLDRVVSDMVARQAGDPAQVGRLVADLLEARHLTLRYPIGPNAAFRQFLAGIAPQWLVDRVVARFLRLPREAPQAP